MSKAIQNKMTSRLVNAIDSAHKASELFGHPHVGTEHLLYGILLQKGSIGKEILNQAGLLEEELKANLIALYDPGLMDGGAGEIEDGGADGKGEKAKANSAAVRAARMGKPGLTVRAKRTIEKAALIANKNGHHFIGTEHLLESLIGQKKATATLIMRELDINIPSIKHHLKVVMESTGKFPDLANVFGLETAAVEKEPKRASVKTPTLNNFCTDLNDEAYKGKIDPVIGREKEVERLINILNRRTKNNPALIGEPGVGKTAIVEGLARKIVSGEVPDVLLNKRILNLDLASVIAGTVYRGEFEGRLKQIIQEAKSDESIILFIDELHIIIGTGNAGGNMDAGQILKPALARGEIQVIGATTLDEYKKHIEKDAALERRFQPIIVEEPTPEETFEVLKGIRPEYEKYHNIKISNEAVKAAVDLSTRYIQDRFLPDKAIDLLDEAASMVRIKVSGRAYSDELQKRQGELTQIINAKKKAVETQDFQKAIELRKEESKIISEIEQAATKGGKAKKVARGKVEQEDIAKVVSIMTKIPLQKLAASESKKLLALSKSLKRRIVGQDKIVEKVASFIQRSRAGITDPQRPIGSFMFLGPSGVGKTELARVLAEEVFEDPQALIRIDMSEFTERFNISRLLGAPAGYVGYEEGGKLTETIRKRPHSVVLFDEIEKGHPDVFNVLLQILEDGQVTDAGGRAINFKNTIIIMTSNVGARMEIDNGTYGFEADGTVKTSAAEKKAVLEREHARIKRKALSEIRDVFRPEFLNRVDKTLVFRPLGVGELRKIVNIQVGELKERLQKNKIQLNVPAEVKAVIVNKSYDPTQGARKVRKIVEEQIEDKLAQALLEKPGARKARVVKKGKNGIGIEVL